MWRKTLYVAIVAVAVLAPPGVVGVIGVSGAIETTYPARNHITDPGPGTSELDRPVEIDASRPTVAVVLGEDGANAADVLPPYEVFAASGRFNVLTVAPTSEPVTLTGGLDLVPDLSFAELDARLTTPPDVIVIPQINGTTSAVIQWLRDQDSRGDPLVLGVCVGSEVLADAGLLDGRPATSHWLKLIGLRRSHPDIAWVEGVRFVDDGDIITTGAVLSGIDGALRVVERLADPTTAARVADELHWDGYRPGGSLTIPTQSPRPGDLVALLSAGFRWDRPRTGVLITDGVGEIELASAFRPYTELSYLARLTAMSPNGEPIRSRHGLTFLPRADAETDVLDLDRILTLGDSHHSDVPMGSAVRITPLHRDGEFAFDGALRDIATTYDTATARWVAKSLQYPLPQGLLADAEASAWPWNLSLRPLLLGAAGGLAALLLMRLRRRTIRRHDKASRPHPRPDDTSDDTESGRPIPVAIPVTDRSRPKDTRDG